MKKLINKIIIILLINDVLNTSSPIESKNNTPTLSKDNIACDELIDLSDFFLSKLNGLTENKRRIERLINIIKKSKTELSEHKDRKVHNSSLCKNLSEEISVKKLFSMKDEDQFTDNNKIGELSSGFVLIERTLQNLKGEIGIKHEDIPKFTLYNDNSDIEIEENEIRRCQSWPLGGNPKPKSKTFLDKNGNNKMINSERKKSRKRFSKVENFEFDDMRYSFCDDKSETQSNDNNCFSTEENSEAETEYISSNENSEEESISLNREKNRFSDLCDFSVKKIPKSIKYDKRSVKKNLGAEMDEIAEDENEENNSYNFNNNNNKKKRKEKNDRNNDNNGENEEMNYKSMEKEKRIKNNNFLIKIGIIFMIIFFIIGTFVLIREKFLLQSINEKIEKDSKISIAEKIRREEKSKK